MPARIPEITEFQEVCPSPESYWRSVIIFGRNVASYKFAFAESLIELAAQGKSSVTLADLSDPFSRHICEHIRAVPKQTTSSTSRFLDACSQFNAGAISHDQLLETTESLGFVNVVDAFHNVNGDILPIKFYDKDYQRGSKRLILTDAVFELAERTEKDQLDSEIESRWRLVETAWELKVSPSILDIEYDSSQSTLCTSDASRRRNITGAKNALNGYQKGKCFYCYADISTNPNSPNACDVDHFFPHVLSDRSLVTAGYMPDINIDGVWNLVLACKECNRGSGGKFAKVPVIEYLTRLEKRNEFLIASHHPLRETLMRQTGLTKADRRRFLDRVNKAATNLLVARWKTKPRGPAAF